MIDLERRGGLVVLRLSHGKANALDLELCRALSTALAEIEDGTSRAVVLTGQGRSFSAGVDLLRVLDGGADYVRTFLPALSQAARRVFAFSRPLVAAINGHAIAGGCLIACAADRRLMASGDAGIGVPELQVGVPFPAVAMEILRSTVPAHEAQRLVLGGTILSPAEAVAVGLVDEVVPADELIDRALAVAESLASIPSASFALTKQQLRAPAQERLAATASAVDAEVDAVWCEPETLAALRAYVEKRLKKPRG